jgi:hypothetical protein
VGAAPRVAIGSRQGKACEVGLDWVRGGWVGGAARRAQTATAPKQAPHVRVVADTCVLASTWG